MTLYNTREFYHSTSNKWLKGLNYGKNFDPEEWYTGDPYVFESLLEESFLLYNEFLQSPYDFPDEDFCLFQHFPHHQLVIYIPFIVVFSVLKDSLLIYYVCDN